MKPDYRTWMCAAAVSWCDALFVSLSIASVGIADELDQESIVATNQGSSADSSDVEAQHLAATIQSATDRVRSLDAAAWDVAMDIWN